MKTKLIIGIITIALLSVVVPARPVYAQDTVKMTKREIRKAERKKRKEQKEKEALEQRLKYAKMLKEKKFVFQADKLFAPDGVSFNVTPSINFFAVNDSVAVFQFGFEGVIGWNGVGGLTYDGYVQNYKFNPGKKRNQAMSAEAQVRSRHRASTAYFTITVMDNGSASVNITPPYGGGSLRMSGQIVSLDEAKVFKGQSLY